MEVKPISWSHSRVNDYNMCPRMFYWKHAAPKEDRIPFVKTAAMIEGERVHKVLELRVSQGTPFTGADVRYEPLAQSIIKCAGLTYTEIDLVLDRQLAVCGKWDRTAWVRAIIDVLKINDKSAFAGDWKTGTIQTDTTQLKLTAAMIFNAYPQVEKVTTAYIWLKDQIVDPETYTRDELPKIWNDLLKVPMQMQESNTTGDWPAKPSYKCGWCDVNKLGKCNMASKPYGKKG